MIVHVFGPKTKKTLMRLMALLIPFNIVIYNAMLNFNIL
ncbi:IS1 family transposase [Xenorhabdus eapokensis]